MFTELSYNGAKKGGLNMKKICFILSLILILCCCSCTINFNKPDTVTIEEREYKKAFIGELYPIDDVVSSEDIKISGNSYYKCFKTQYDCYIAYDRNAEPNVYFSSEQFDEAFSFYNDASNFNFFCLLGNIHDENNQKILEIQEIDSLMFNRLFEYSAKNDYNPSTSFNSEDGLKKVPISNPDDWLSDEIHFYKESKDGAFSTSRGYTFILYENKLCLLYQYDFSDKKSPVMLIRYVPTEISDYFCSLLENLQGK